MRSALGWAAAGLLIAVSLTTANSGEDRQNGIPLPEIAVAKAGKPPHIDGVIEPGEWDAAPALTGFVVPGSPHQRLARNQSVYRITYDDQFIYVAIKNYRGATWDMLAKNAREEDDISVVFDTSNEIWFTPPSSPQATFQSIFNTYPCVYDIKMIPSLGYSSQGWRAGWEIASTETDEYWIVEARAPIRSFGVERITDGSSWHALFSTDVLGGKDGGFRRWGPWITSGFKDISGHGPIRFHENTPVVQVYDVESLFTGKLKFPMGVTGPMQGKSKVAVTVRIGAGPAQAATDMIMEKAVEVENGRHEEFTLEGDVARAGLPEVEIAERGSSGDTTRKCPQGFCEITAKTADGPILYHSLFPFVVDGFTRTPAQIKKSPYDAPFGVTAKHAPLSKKLLVKIDRLYMDNREAAAKGQARLVDLATKKAVVSVPIAPFRHDFSKFAMDVSALKLPVETEADWAGAKKAREENKLIDELNKELKGKGQAGLPLRELPGPKPAEFSLEVSLADAAGKEIATTAVPVRMMDYQFEWLGHNLGISDKVLPPWTPLAWSNGILSMWNKRYRLNGLGLAEEIWNSNAKQLSGPMRLVARIDGKEVEVAGGMPVMRKLSEANADLTGTANCGDLDIQVKTRVEFDGFVRNTMTIAPRKPVPVERLALVVAIPKSEADCFMTTAGGWNACNGFTPEKWDSRESTAGTRLGNFMPYILLTDSERGFCWFGDNDKGYVLDPKEPTQELTTQDDQVILRINFINKPGILGDPTTVEYGWMVSPQKPQPSGWRAWSIDYRRYYPKARTVFYADFDRRVCWDYYSSPYPMDMDKSRTMINPDADQRKVVRCVGHTGDALGFYEDYKGRSFAPLCADWGEQPGVQGSGEVARSRGPNDYEIWHWDRWIRLGGLSGIYFDINYLGDNWNYLTGTAYVLPDGRIQPGYGYLGQREYQKRLRYIFNANGKQPPNIWLHSTHGQPIFSWLADVTMEGEDAHPSGSEGDDYQDAQPAGRLRSIGRGSNLGVIPTTMCQASRNTNSPKFPFLAYQYIGWMGVHDVIGGAGDGTAFWHALAAENEFWRDDIRFLPYWRTGLGVEPKTDGVIASALVYPHRALVWIVNTVRENRVTEIQFDFAKLGLDAGRTAALDAETGLPLELRRSAVSLPVPGRLWRAVRLIEPQALKAGETFSAHFENGEAVADEAIGHPYAFNDRMDALVACAPGKSGNGMWLDETVNFSARNHISPECGSIQWQVFLGAASAGCLLSFDRGPKTIQQPDEAGIQKLIISYDKGQVGIERVMTELTGDAKQPTKQFKTVMASAGWKIQDQPSWHSLEIRWQDKQLILLADSSELLRTDIPDGMPIQPAQSGLSPDMSRLQNWGTSMFAFGPMPGAAIDDLVCRRP